MLSNTFEGGTNGAAVTPANSGGSSGNAFDAVTTGGSGSITFASGAAIHGKLGLQAQTNGNTNSSVQWSSSFGSPTQFWVRDYFVIGLLPTVIARLFQGADNSAAVQWAVAVDTSGHIGIRNISAGSFPSGGLSGATLTPGQLNRYELSASYSGGAWTVVLRVFLGANCEGTTPDFTLSPSAMTLNALASYSFGAILPSVAFWNADHDDTAMSTDGWIGPFQAFNLQFRRAYAPGRIAPLWRTRRGAAFAPPWTQGRQGASAPLTLRRAGSRPRWAPYIRRGRFFVPVRAQSAIPPPFPLVTRHRAPAYWSFAPSLRPQRGRIFQPRWPQSNQGVQFPLFTRGRPEIYRRWGPRLYRGRFFSQRVPQAPQGSPFNLVTRHQSGYRPRWIAPRRVLGGRVMLPPWPQANQGTHFPLRVRRSDNALIRFARIWRSPRMRQWYQAKLTAHASASLSAAGTLTATALANRIASAHLAATGTLSVSPVITRPASASLSAGTMKATVSLDRAASASLSGTGILTAAGVVTKTASAALSGTGTLTATASESPGARLAAAGILTASAHVQQQASAALSATGTLLAVASVIPPAQEILVDGNRIAPWDEVIATGAWQRREPPDAPAVITAQGITGTYDEE